MLRSFRAAKATAAAPWSVAAPRTVFSPGTRHRPRTSAAAACFHSLLFRDRPSSSPCVGTTAATGIANPGLSAGTWRGLPGGSIPDATTYCGTVGGGDRTRLRQVRWKRRDGNKAFSKVRPPTKKQRKAYNRKMQAKQTRDVDRHGRPNSKASLRREWIETAKGDLLNGDDSSEDDDLSLLEYGVEDALLDDLIGNTKELSSQPTPRPRYLGHEFGKHDAELRRQVGSYRNEIAAASTGDDNSDVGTSAVAAAALPSDRVVSMALRAYRDKFGTRHRPIGIVKALEYLLKDVGLPVSAFGELTFTALMSCCRTPTEARRIMQMMKQEQRAVSAYSWSIFVDVFAKIGDYKGAAGVLEEMVAEGVPPTLPAYTSFLAACYRVCSDGRKPHPMRADAGKKAFEKWQEMRVVGVQPDAMTYGAMLRLCAAQGHPERALNLLEEMQQMEVNPTTLCFSSALRAVAKSHATAVRYERGASKKNRRREFIAQHHGKMARAIVIQAENAEVEQDDGFVSALILCSAAAGDAATAKAIYVASQVRRLDQFRTIGSDSHLAKLRGDAPNLLAQEPEQILLSNIETGDLPAFSPRSIAPQSTDSSWRRVPHFPTFEEREYGKDSRVFSAILHACAQAVDQNGIGSMWMGRENRGYLCENSLRLLTAQRVPRYTDNSIPGQGRTDDLTWDGEHKDDDYRGDKRSPRKFTGVEVIENSANNLDELDDRLARIFVDEEGRRKEEFRNTTSEDIWRMKYGEDTENHFEQHLNADENVHHYHGLISSGDGTETLQDDDEGEEVLYFDYDCMRWKTRLAKVCSGLDATEPKHNASERARDIDDDEEPSGGSKIGITAQLPQELEEMYFDSSTMRWKTRIKSATAEIVHTNYESQLLQVESVDTKRVSKLRPTKCSPCYFARYQ